MPSDQIEQFGRSQVQHGKLSNRIYLMNLHEEDLPGLLQMLEDLAKKNAYTKIFAKIPRSCAAAFENKEFRQEAMIPRFFGGKEEGVFMSRFFNGRDCESSAREVRAIIDLARKKAGNSSSAEVNSKYVIRKAEPADIDQICGVFMKVFDSYPFPIFDPKYISQTMNGHVDYYVACEDDRIVSVSSAEIDRENKNAEMTDFATLTEFRAQGIAQRLLQCMEEDMRKQGLCVLYTIARAMSAGMNITFAKSGYQFGGTLVNNTQISGNIESMNVWYKNLKSD